MKNAREMRTKTGQIDDEYECEKKVTAAQTEARWP